MLHKDDKLLRVLFGYATIGLQQPSCRVPAAAAAPSARAGAQQAAAVVSRGLVTALVSAQQAASKTVEGGGGFKEWYVKAIETSPVATKAMTALVMSSVGNIAGQAVKGSVDLRFTLKYALVCMPPYSHFWYLFLGRLPLPVIAKVALDQTFWRSLMIWWSFVSFGLVNGDSADDIKRKVEAEFWPTLQAGFKVWPAVQLVNMYFVPALYQTTTLDFVCFFWDMYMTMKMGGKGRAGKAKAKGIVDEDEKKE